MVSQTFAQRDAGEKVFGLHLGGSLTGVFINASGSNMKDSGSVSSFSQNSRPMIALTFDAGLSERWSLGILIANQSFSGTFFDYTYTRLDGTAVTETVTYKMNRNNISFAPKFHYNLKSDKLDMYLGLRFGFVFWNNDFKTTQSDFNPFGLVFGRPNLGLVPFGMRFYANENFGGTFELALGAPYIISIGAQYKLPGL
jgi:hypothetical protein